MILRHNLTSVIGALSLSCMLVSCISLSDKQALKLAENYFEAAQYHKALDYYKQADEKALANKEVKYHIAVSNYSLGNYEEALPVFGEVYKEDGTVFKALWYEGMTLLEMGNYLAASKSLKSYLEVAEQTMTPFEQRALLAQIKRCEVAPRLKFSREYAYIENMGQAVNTSYDEVRPIQSPNNQQKFYFSSNRDLSAGGKRNLQGLVDDLYGHYYYDMYAVELVNGNWTGVYNFNSLQNTAKHEILQHFSGDGSVMFFTKGSQPWYGDILTDTFGLEDEQRAFPSDFVAPISGEIGDKDLFFINSNTAIFSSLREGGYGGYDLYITSYLDSIWCEPMNLGAAINSEANESSPFVTQGGNQLFFSSDRFEGFGGYDVFFTTYDEGQWIQPINIGLPINSVKDDLGFYITNDGTQAALSSNRPGGLGGYDLYLLYWKDAILDQLNYTEQLGFYNCNPTVLDSLSLPASLDSTTLQEVVVPRPNNAGIPAIKFVNNYLYHNTDEDILSPTNTVQLNVLADMMVIIPDIAVALGCHDGVNPMGDVALFFGMKRAEKVRDFLIKKGIAEQRIILTSYSRSHPMYNSAFANSQQKANTRIEIDIINSDEKTLVIEGGALPVRTDEITTEFLQWQASKRQLGYRIKIGETAQMMRNEVLSEVDDISMTKEQNMLVYYVGQYTTYSEARAAKVILMSSGKVASAEITPFIGLRKLFDPEIDSYISKYPDLMEFQNMGK